MKRLLSLLFMTVVIMLSMVACDLGSTEDPNKDNPGVSQNGGETNNGGENNGGEENKGGTQGGENNNGDAQNANDIVLHGWSTPEDYTDAAIEIIRSLGKTVKNERLVIVTSQNDSVVYTVHLYDKDSGKITASYECQFYEKDEEASYKYMSGYTYDQVETDDAALMIKTTHLDIGDSTFDDEYEFFKGVIADGTMDATIVE